MAKETIKFEDEKSEELYNWLNEEYSPEKLADIHLLIPECIGVLKGFKRLGLNYKWIDGRINTLMICATFLATM